MTLNTTRCHMCHMYTLLVSTSPIFHSGLLYNEAFLKYRPFWDKCTKWPQIDIEPNKVKLPYICATTFPECQISFLFTLRPVVVELQAIVRQVHRNDLRKALETTRSKVHHICVTCVPESQISICFALWQLLLGYRTFYNSPLTTILNVKKKYIYIFAKNSKFGTICS